MFTHHEHVTKIRDFGALIFRYLSKELDTLKRVNVKWRRRRDSNPRYRSRYTPLAGERLRPLGHFSGIDLDALHQKERRIIPYFLKIQRRDESENKGFPNWPLNNLHVYLLQLSKDSLAYQGQDINQRIAKNKPLLLKSNG